MLLRLPIFLIVFILSVLLNVSSYSEEGRTPTEHEVKAAYIYNFAKFIDWPPGYYQEADSAINVCIIGEDPFASALETIEGKIAGGRKIRIKQNPPHRSGCDILFISKSEKEQLGRILEGLGGRGILTIGDTKGFAEQGVMINFYMEDRRVLFEINPRAAGRAGLKISSNLLKIAKIVGSP